MPSVEVAGLAAVISLVQSTLNYIKLMTVTFKQLYQGISLSIHMDIYIYIYMYIYIYIYTYSRLKVHRRKTGLAAVADHAPEQPPLAPGAGLVALLLLSSLSLVSLLLLSLYIYIYTYMYIYIYT